MSLETGLLPLALAPAAGVALVLLLAGLLRAPPGHERANPWLTTALVSLGGLILGDFARDSLLVLRLPHLSHLADWLAFLFGPCLWLYTCRVTGLAGPRGQRLAVHFIPAAAMLLVLLPSWFEPAAVKHAAILQQLERRRPWPDVLYLLVSLHMLAYWMLASLRLRRHVASLAADPASGELQAFARLLGRLRVCWAAWAVWVATGLVGLPRYLP